MWNTFKNYISHPYFLQHFLVFCFSAYLLCYGFIRTLNWTKAKESSSVRTLIKDGYNSWLWGFAIHCATMLAISSFLFYKIWQQKRLSSDWIYLPPGFLFLFLDVAWLLVIAKRKHELLGLLR